MKIALCSSYVPFVGSGARNIVDWLNLELVQAGHITEVVNIPHSDEPDELLPQLMAYRWIDLVNSADRIVCFRPPSHLIAHPNKVLWFIHHVRAYYDLWESPYRGFDITEQTKSIQAVVRAADGVAFSESKRIFANSAVVADRLKKFNGVDSEVLYPPLLLPERFLFSGLSGEIVSICRVEAHKRQHLLLDALRYTKTPVSIRICGVSANQQYTNDLCAFIQINGLEDRVSFENRWIDDGEKVDVLSKCLASAYLPFDEDSYGYPSLEAAYSLKPVLTTADSGGVLELVEHGHTGVVAESSPQAIAEAMDYLFLNRGDAGRMGRNLRSRVDEMNIGWQHTIERLLA